MTFRLCGLLAGLLPALAAAGECRMSDWQQARAKWDAAAITSYRYTFWREAGAWSNAASPVRVTVSHGRVVAARTFPGLLDLIRKHLEQPGIEAYRCTFHTELGWPLAHWYGMKNVYDADASFSVTDLEILR